MVRTHFRAGVTLGEEDNLGQMVLRVESPRVLMLLGHPEDLAAVAVSFGRPVVVVAIPEVQGERVAVVAMTIIEVGAAGLTIKASIQQVLSVTQEPGR